jgi:hypothetical protein
MILGQIPPDMLSQIAAEVKVDLRVLSVTLRKQDRVENRFARLQAAVAYLSEHVEIGDLDAPRSYFAGTSQMRWGIYENKTQPDGPNPVALFIGPAKENVIVLTGSPEHVIGVDTPLTEQAGLATRIHSLKPGFRPFSQNPWTSHMRLDEQSRDADFRQASVVAGEFHDYMVGPVYSVEFLARRLATEPWNPDRDSMGEWPDPGGSPHTLLFGSPVYVALADDLEAPPAH